MSQTPQQPRPANPAGGLYLILILAVLVCAYDVYSAMRSGGHNPITWGLAALMALVALGTLRKIIRRDYSNTLW